MAAPAESVIRKTNTRTEFTTKHLTLKNIKQKSEYYNNIATSSSFTHFLIIQNGGESFEQE